MAQALGAHNSHIARVRELQDKKGRREQRAFSFEGTTLLEEALRSEFPLTGLYATQHAYDAGPLLRALDARGIPVYILDERTFAKISDLETPTGTLAVAPQRFVPLAGMISTPGVALALADLKDPGNAGTLVRSADAFGATGVIFGDLGVDPYHPKVVRSAMGSLFRLPIAIATPVALQQAAAEAQAEIVGLDGSGTPLLHLPRAPKTILLAGNERQGLGRWQGICRHLAAIPMTGSTESLNAGVAGSIALYELTRR